MAGISRVFALAIIQLNAHRSPITFLSPSHSFRPSQDLNSLSDVIGSTLRWVSQYGQRKWLKLFFLQAHRSVDSARKALEKYSLLLLCGVDLKVERLKSCFCLSVNSIGKCDKFRYDWLKPRDDVTRPTNSKVKLIMNFEHEKRKKREIFNWNQLRYANDVKTCHNTISAFVLRVNFFHTANNPKLSKKRKHQKCASLMKWINPVNYVTTAMP